MSEETIQINGLFKTNYTLLKIIKYVEIWESCNQLESRCLLLRTIKPFFYSSNWFQF